MQSVETWRYMSKIVDRTLDFLELFAKEKRPLSLSDISRLLSIPVSSCHDVLQALQEVDNALSAYADEQRRHDRLAAAARESQTALDLSRQLYGRGLTDFLKVLDAQRTLLSARQQLADSGTTLSTGLVTLYKALGGGWETRFPEQTASR